MILVTGGSGYVGSHIVKKLVQAGKRVRILARNPDRIETEGRLADLKVEIAIGDVTQPETLIPAFEGVAAVIHTVAIAIEKGGQRYEEINTQGTANVIAAAQNAGIKRFINISQLGADSQLPYRFLASKGLAQEHVAASDLDWTAFRPSVIWGSEDEFANTFAKLVPISPIIYPIVDNRAQFQPVWVEDVASAVIEALDNPNTFGQEFELGGPEVLGIEEIERRTLAAMGAKRIFIPFPRPILTLIVALLEALLPAPPVTRSLLELLAVNNVTSNNALPQFVTEPRPFTAENAAEYMQDFNFSETIAQFMGK